MMAKHTRTTTKAPSAKFLAAVDAAAASVNMDTPLIKTLLAIDEIGAAITVASAEATLAAVEQLKIAFDALGAACEVTDARQGDYEEAQSEQNRANDAFTAAIRNLVEVGPSV